MKKSELYVVNLPNLKPTVELPPALAVTLQLIIDASPCDISTPQLQEAGIVSVHNNVANLRKRGAIIYADKRDFTDRFGRGLKCIAHFSYKGWIDNSDRDKDMEA